MKWGRGGYLAKPKRQYTWVLSVVICCLAISIWFFVATKEQNIISTSVTVAEKKHANKILKKEPKIVLNEPLVIEKELSGSSDCSQIIGRVFNDQNGNGKSDKGETGLPSVRISTVNGLSFSTDKHGRYHLPCDTFPDDNIGFNFILKLDTRSLPKGYIVSGQNPQVIKIVDKKIHKVNFAVASLRIVKISFSSKAFESDKIYPTENLVAAVDRIIQHLETKPSVLRMSYLSRTDDKKLAKKRMNHLARVVMERWNKSERDYELVIETNILDA